MDGVDVRSVGLAIQRRQEPSHMAASLLMAVYDELLRSGLVGSGPMEASGQRVVAESCDHWRSDGSFAEVAAIRQGGCHANVSSGETSGTLCSGVERKAS